MAKKRKRTRSQRKQNKQTQSNRLIPDPKRYAKAIIKALDGIVAATGYRPHQIMDDWLVMVKASLETLPQQLIAVAKTGQFQQDSPETAEIFQRVETRYRRNCYGSFEERVWRDGFCQAFSLLLEGTAPGLWAYGHDPHGSIMGPDILGDIYQTWAQTDPSWQAQYFTPYLVAKCAAEITLHGIERQIYDRLKEALCHPDNILGQALLMTSLVIPEQSDPSVYQDYFFNKLLPACLEYYSPLKFYEPAIGSGIMMLSAAGTCPPWAVKYGLITFSGNDIDYTCYLMASINAQIYGLNGYALKLEAAVAEALTIRQQQVDAQSISGSQSAAQAIQNVYRNGDLPPVDNSDKVSFEQMFRAVAVQQPVPTETVEV